MSLINEALKKAQARQGGEAPMPGSGAGNTFPPSGPGGGQKSFPNWWVLIFLLLGVAVSVAAATWLLVWGLQAEKDPAPPEEVAQSSAQPATNTAGNSEKESIDRIAFKEPENPASSPTRPPQKEAAAEPAPSKIPTPSNQSKASPDRETTAAKTENVQATAATKKDNAVSSTSEGRPRSPSPTASDPPAEEKPKPVPQPAVQEYLTSLEIRGIMMGGDKVLIFHPELSRTVAYETGGELENALKIKIHNVYKDRIAFIDDGGFIYIKRF